MVSNMKRKNVAEGVAHAKVRDKPGAGTGLGVNSEIGRKLKQYYDDLLTDEVPDRFADLLSQLEKAETTVKED
jgi:hypothetical protein